MQKEVAEAANAPKAVGSHSQAITVNGFMFLSAQLPVDPATRSFVGDAVCERTRRCFLNIAEALKAKVSSINNIVKVFVFLKDLCDSYKMNGFYAAVFSSAFPPHSCVEVLRLSRDAKVEFEATALC